MMSVAACFEDMFKDVFVFEFCRHFSMSVHNTAHRECFFTPESVLVVMMKKFFGLPLCNHSKQNKIHANHCLEWFSILVCKFTLRFAFSTFALLCYITSWHVKSRNMFALLNVLVAKLFNYNFDDSGVVNGM
ncbi:CLUMA_CG010092, isoform A [Clunio marinus]|uniref:CLUMA_CG010092, isoform A n=1 Tax=Clunio marinus TaxID=568069 RepID=A0A1J1ICA8_9DIPT|nr:CLUMA_CG010092, isoform A [Clunio marinus]